MERDEVNEFLKKMGMREDRKPQQNQWEQIVIPSSSYLVVGDVGTGKSALCFWLLETFSQKYNLQPVVVGFPRDKKALLPDNFVVLDEPDALTKVERAIALIDEADIQLPIEDTKARKHVINFLSLPRHRHQIFLLSFHFPRLVLGRYLPFFSAFILKRPPYLIEFASKGKNDALVQMMLRAEERFAELVPPNWHPTEVQVQPLEVIRHTYVVAPRIRWQGMIANSLASFWSQELSEAWSGMEIEVGPKPQKDLFQYYDPNRLVATDGKTPITEEMRRRAIKLEQYDMRPPNKIMMDPFTNLKWVE
jgi:hypothetical protein